MSGGVLVFRYASHSGVSLGWSSMGIGSSRGAAAAGGDKHDDRVASKGDRMGVTGALDFSVNVSHKSCSVTGTQERVWEHPLDQGKFWEPAQV